VACWKDHINIATFLKILHEYSSGIGGMQNAWFQHLEANEYCATSTHFRFLRNSNGVGVEFFSLTELKTFSRQS